MIIPYNYINKFIILVSEKKKMKGSKFKVYKFLNMKMFKEKYQLRNRSNMLFVKGIIRKFVNKRNIRKMCDVTYSQ